MYLQMYDFVLLIHIFLKHGIWIYRCKSEAFLGTKIYGMDL